jgi:hypothetical protein
VEGFWRGLAALRRRSDRARVAGCVVLTAACDLARSLLLLHAAGLPANVVDVMALRIATGVLAALPIGMSSTAGAALLIFGAGGVGRAAAAGVLITATGLAADLAFAAWGAGDLAARARPARPARAADLAAAVCCAGLTLGFVAGAAR